MTFKVAKVREVMWPVTINVPGDGGKSQVHKVNVRLEILGQDEADDIIYGRTEEKDLLNRVLKGWDDTVRDEAGEALPFDDETKRAFLQLPYVRRGLMEAYGEASVGGRRKN